MKQTAVALVFALAIVVFAIQNSGNVNVGFLFWRLNCSLALLLIIVLMIGIFTGMLVAASGQRKKNVALRAAEKRVAKLERRLADRQTRETNGK